jgi:hypothetical protein
MIRHLLSKQKFYRKTMFSPVTTLTSLVLRYPPL